MDIAMCFHVHQPFRLRRFSIFSDVNLPPERAYFDNDPENSLNPIYSNKTVFQRATKECYLPATNIILEHANVGRKFCYSVTGTWVESAMRFGQEALDIMQSVASTGNVEFLGETYFHSLAGLYNDLSEFDEQVNMHKEMLREFFDYKPRVFRNTELIYDNRIGERVESLGFKAQVIEGAEKVLGWRAPTYVYKRKGGDLRLLTRHYRLSDDIGFRFSNQSWSEWPLTADKYADWVSNVPGEYILVYVDYETFGEHHKRETGILEFLRHLPDELEKRGVRLVTPSEIIKKHEPKDELDVPEPISWADVDRDVSTWLGNPLQQYAFKKLQSLRLNTNRLKRIWRLLQTSDHLYYLSKKTGMDGWVHQYFSPYNSPYDAFINFMNILDDLKRRSGN
uniref:Alpha-amylase/alpha-mannosidase n=1 Tax=uncultured euryarchaeote Alv-FOS5 TaxID=337891 RepID=Q3SB92_9EURY|nr:alpha-amylase/alpha-mannosidase [uncultured euryarchaeote Alv-FOS5]